jgi:KaiC/GvpD/RAD55 family RecA-like ATPase
MPTVLEAARLYAAAGLSVIPIRLGGQKSPAWESWSEHEKRIATADELDRMFSRNVGIAIIGGAVSGNLEILDFDKPGIFETWLADLAELDIELHAVALSLPRVHTPAQGMHLYYRCDEISGNTKLARARVPFVDCTGKEKTVLIETRGEGGYVLAPPSPPECHKANRAYEWIGGAKLTDIPTVTPAQRNIFFQAARTYNQVASDAPVNSERHAATPGGAGRPGDDFNARGPAWSELLTPHGWTLIGSRGECDRWRRPGKDDGLSATTGHCGDKFYVFSSNAAPFEAERAYDKFGAFALLEHQGDIKAAARALGSKGYGEKPQRQLPEAPPDETPHTVEEEAKKEQVRSAVKAMRTADLLDLWESLGDHQAIPTPLQCLDEVLGGGWPVGQVTIVKAYAKVGKSEFCRQSLLTAALSGYPIIHVDVELGPARLAERMISQATKIPPTKLRKRKELADEQKEHLARVTGLMRQDKFMQFICPGGAVPLDELEQSIRAALCEVESDKPALLVLDSAQRLAMGSGADSIRMQVTDFMCSVTRAAMTMNAAILLVSEESRAAAGGIPTAAQAMTSGAESRSIEYQTDVMVCLYNEDKAEEDTEACAADAEGERRVQIKVAANRNGFGTGFLPDSVVFEAPCWGMRVEPRKKQEIEDMILGALGFDDHGAKSSLALAKELHRRVVDVRHACQNLVDGQKLVVKGTGPKAKFYRSRYLIPDPGSGSKIPTPDQVDEEEEHQLVLP